MVVYNVTQFGHLKFIVQMLYIMITHLVITTLVLHNSFPCHEELFMLFAVAPLVQSDVLKHYFALVLFLKKSMQQHCAPS